MSSLAEKKPELLKEWDYKKNNVKPTEISTGIRENFWWICPKGHSYQARIDRRLVGNGCPYCSGHRVLSGFNDLATIVPKSLSEWDYKKNNIKPTEIYVGSTRNAFFVCPQNHKYQMVIRDYAKGYNCPICSNRIIKKGFNDFASFDERLLKEWDYEKNGKLKPTDISYKSIEKVWWVGECGHRWQASVNSRTMLKTNCPICAEERHASISEKSILFYIINSNKYDKVLENYKDEIIKLELDIYIPSSKVAIEYDGERWHRDIEKDLRKDLMCQENKIKLIRVRENGCPSYESPSIKINLINNNNDGLEQGIKEVLKILNIKGISVDIVRDTPQILGMINFMIKENSILTLYPKLAKEWHPTKNGNLMPKHTKPGSNKKVWWICPKGHEYQLSVCSRTERGNGCPYCSGHRVLKGYNDLESKYPKLAKEWHPTKNGFLKPSDVTSNSDKKVWWICSKGHEWKTSISKRTKGRGCPYCSGQQVLKGYNDLATLNSKLLKEWDYEKNISISPEDVTAHSSRKVWWKCITCGNEWKASIDHRSRGRGCPKCARERTINARCKKVLQFSLDGKLLAEYKSASEASRLTGIPNIKDICRKEKSFAKGFVWKYDNKK